MKQRGWMYSTAVALLASVLLAACSMAPSDAEVIKAVSQSNFFAGGYGNKLSEPVVVLERGKRGKDGTWPVKVKAKFTFRKNDGKESVAMESTPLFKLRKAVDGAGKAEWKAELAI